MRTLVVGGNGTLGRAITDVFAKQGSVVATYRSRPFDSAPPNVTQLPLDLRLRESVLAFARIVSDEKIDALIVVAGENHDALIVRESPDVFAESITAFVCNTNALLEALIRSLTGGHIVLVSSIVGVEGSAGQAVYSATKGALIGLVYERAREFAVREIKINAILPGMFRSPMTEALPAEAYTTRVEKNALGRSQTVEEIASFVAHLTSMRNVSGQVFNLDSRPLSPY